MLIPLSDIFSVNIEGVVGSLLIGVFVSSILFGILTLHVCWYYIHLEDRDRSTLRVLVAAVWLLELGHAITTFHFMYFTVIQQLLRAEGRTWILQPPQSIALSLFLSGVITPTIQIYFAQRVRIIGNWLAIYVTCICSLASSGVFVMTCVITYRVSSEPVLVLDLYVTLRTLVSVTLIATTAADVVLAIALWSYLRWSYLRKLQESGLTSNRLALRVKGIMFWAIETGIMTSCVVLLLLFTFLFMPTTFAWKGIYVCVTRVHSISFLVSLNSRKRKNVNFGPFTSQEGSMEDLEFELAVTTKALHV